MTWNQFAIALVSGRCVGWPKTSSNVLLAVGEIGSEAKSLHDWPAAESGERPKDNFEKQVAGQ